MKSLKQTLTNIALNKYLLRRFGILCLALFYLCSSSSSASSVLQTIKEHYGTNKLHKTEEHQKEKSSQPSSASTPISLSANVNAKQTLPEQKNQIPIKENYKQSVATDSELLWNFRQVDIRSVIAEVAKQTGKNFIVDPRVQGKVTLISSKSMDAEALYQVFLSVLQVLGYTAVPSGQVIKIVPDADAKTQGNRIIMDNTMPHHGDEMIVRIINTQHIAPDQLIPLLRPLMTPSEHISASPHANAIILSGRANNLERIINIIQRVDVASNHDIDIIPLRYALAQDIVSTLQALQSSPDSMISQQKLSIAADERSNSVLISGNKAARLHARILVTELDGKNPHGTEANTQVIRLAYLRATDVVPILAGVAQANFSGEVGTTIGTLSEFTKTPMSSTTANSSEYAAADTTTTQDKTAQTNKTTGQVNKPKIEIIAEPNTNSVIINAPPTLMRTLKTVLNKLDVRPAQVLVEALIAEIDEENMQQLGIEWGSFVAANNESGKSNRVFQPGIAIIHNKMSLQDFQARITALASSNKADILSTPSIVVLDNHQAKILVGQQVSIQDSSYPNNANATTTASPYTTFKRLDVALHLNVTPQINRGNAVLLKIDHGNNTLRDPNDNSGRPVVNQSNINTSVIVNNGDILVLGGLTQNQLQNTRHNTPILSDLPGIGQIFQNTRHNRNKKVLMIFLRPTIIHHSQEAKHFSQQQYQNVRTQQIKGMQQQPYLEQQHEVILPSKPSHKGLPSPFAEK